MGVNSASPTDFGLCDRSHSANLHSREVAGRKRQFAQLRLRPHGRLHFTPLLTNILTRFRNIVPLCVHLLNRYFSEQSGVNQRLGPRPAGLRPSAVVAQSGLTTLANGNNRSAESLSRAFRSSCWHRTCWDLFVSTGQKALLRFPLRKRERVETGRRRTRPQMER